VRVVDVIEPYNIGNNVEVIRSLKPETIMLSTVGFDHKPGTPMTAEDRLRQRQAVRPVWWELFHSHQGTIIWDNQEETGTFVDLKSGQLTPSAETFRDVFRELRSGMGMLVMNCARTQDGVAIHYSHPSVQAHWLLENVKKARDWMMNTVEAYVTSRFIAVRNSWTKLIEDLQVQYDFVSASQVASGALGTGKYRIFILPESIAISQSEAQEIRDFVRNGGTLVADFRAAQLNEHCRDLGDGQLNDVFGIAEGNERSASGTARGKANEGPLQLAGKDLGTIAAADGTLTTTTGRALAQCGEIPMIVVNEFGKGRAIYLNMDMSGYAFDRLNPNASATIPDIVDSILGMASIRPRVRVMGSDGKRLPGTEIVIFKNGVCEEVAIFRNPQLDDGGWGSYREKKSNWRDWTTDADNSVFEKEAAVTIEWESAIPTYDVRGKRDIGAIVSCKAILDPWEPLIFSRTPVALPKFHLAASPECSAGSSVEITLTTDGAHPEGTVRIVRLEFKDPSGNVLEFYSQNVMVSALPHTLRIPIAFNDPVGSWNVHGLDLMSGQSLQASFLVNKSGTTN